MTENQGDEVESNAGDDAPVATTIGASATMTQGRNEGASRNTQSDSTESISSENRKSNNIRRDTNIVNIVSVSKTYERSTPETGGVLGLQNENVDKKVNFSIFCKRLGTYIMK